MIKKVLPLAGFLGLLVFGCKTFPAGTEFQAETQVSRPVPGENKPQADEVPRDEVPAPSFREIPEVSGELPEELPGEEPGSEAEPAFPDAVDEPVPDLAEAYPPEAAPPEKEVPPELPEPAAPVFPEPSPEPSPEPEPSEPVQAEPPAPVSSESDQPPSAPETPQPGPPPAPPPFIRPAEPEPAPPPAREGIPLPVNPVPEPPARSPPAAAGEEAVFSRVVAAETGQILEIPFRGTGWVYLGELRSQRGIAYVSRRLDPEGQSFILRAEAPGIFELKFYKQDFIQDYILNDYVRVIVTDPPLSRSRVPPETNSGRVIAGPRWPQIPEAGAGNTPGAALPGDRAGETGGDPSGRVDGAGGIRADGSGGNGGGASPADSSSGGDFSVPAGPVPGAPPETGGGSGLPPVRPGLQDDGIVPAVPPEAVVSPVTAMPETPAGSAGAGPPVVPEDTLPAGALPEEYLRRAKEAYEAGRIPSGLAILDLFRERFPSGSDEAWWLYGRMLEAPSPSRDIRGALEYYRRIIREYPQSPRYAEARRRIAYLERYYFNIQ